MFTGMPSTRLAKSVPWSRLKPRRKYWLALPLPLCLGDHEAWHHLQHFAGAQHGTRLQLLAQHRAHRGREGTASQSRQPARCDHHFIQLSGHTRGMRGQRPKQPGAEQQHGNGADSPMRNRGAADGGFHGAPFFPESPAR
jgi:hypothetical protein